MRCTQLTSVDDVDTRLEATHLDYTKTLFRSLKADVVRDSKSIKTNQKKRSGGPRAPELILFGLGVK